MTNSWSYIITHYDSASSWAPTVITEDMISTPLYTDVGSGEVPSAKMILSADKGKYIKSGAGGPQIKQFDRIRIFVDDGETTTKYDKVFDVMKVIPVKTKTQGTRIQLILTGIEQWLYKVNYAKTHFPGTPFKVFKDIGDLYNANKGSLMPTLQLHDNKSANQLPDYIHSIYDYGLNEDTCYARMMDVIDKLGGSGDSGGVLDFFDVRFIHSTVNVVAMDAFVRSSGATPNPVIITDSNTINVGEQEGGIEAFTGTVINAWGANNQGSIPMGFCKFKSRQERFPKTGTSFFAEYVNEIAYKSGSIVTKFVTGVKRVYQANVDTSQTPPHANWTELTPATYYGDTIRYSDFTDEAVTEWKNCGSSPSSLLGKAITGPGFWDANVVVKDDSAGTTHTFRTWVDFFTTTDNYSAFWKYSGSPNGIYRGTRVLVVPTAQGAFVGNDKFGNSFTNAVAEFDGEDWFVRYPAVEGMMVSSLSDGHVFRFTSGAWTAITSSDNGSDCYHYYDTLGSADSAILNRDTGAEFTGNNNGSAVKVTYSWDPGQAVINAIGQTRVNANYYAVGAWLNFRFPFPPNTYNGITRKIGELYGGALQVSGVPDVDKEPATLEMQNMDLTHDGFRGFNAGNSSEDLGPIASIDFFMRILFQANIGLGFTSDAATLAVFGGPANYKMRCYLFDINDNVVYQDFVIFFNNEYQAVSLPLSGFQVYRGRKPVAITLIDMLVKPKELDAQETFEWRHVKQISFQTQESYDEFGRYGPISGRYTGNGSIIVPTAVTCKMELSIDAFRFTKPLLVNSGQDNSRDIEPDFLQKPEIGNYDQLKADVAAELEKSKFQRVEYDIMTTGRNDIKFGDSFLLKDSEIVPTFSPTQPGEDSTTIRLVAKKVEYSITKPVEGKGGFLRTIYGVRRFV